ncbi:hypothetical protein B0H13DRAFT_2261449, partial [Mycena leptocephala]
MSKYVLSWRICVYWRHPAPPPFGLALSVSPRVPNASAGEQGPGPVWMGMFITPIETWVGKSKLAEWHVWAAVIISPEAVGRGKKLLIYDCDGDDVDFQSCRVRDALPLSFQRKLFRRKSPAFAELWRSTYDDSTFG